jgi:hypothetical protein
MKADSTRVRADLGAVFAVAAAGGAAALASRDQSGAHDDLPAATGPAVPGSLKSYFGANPQAGKDMQALPLQPSTSTASSRGAGRCPDRRLRRHGSQRPPRRPVGRTRAAVTSSGFGLSSNSLTARPESRLGFCLASPGR